ncbi:sigma-E processing peptidase SpoIIGA [Thermoanaerobacterium thermosaccharolyticum]|uniref:Sporulation sigma-E factor-processing peptidase n=1 Tax=Thermoanaerobacterium thermosaccharolyticum TaxID=1517 RepID=A0A231VI56_THETR|nr:sigma-E processing peptidase SpoIIGA [Thermoanaerobacterium thermosaccharolyticum]AST58732.1 sigma-E processing peptidase [Thermoanaerobacterium thermosaccharolyticum]OXT07842.1 sigma-E processing peptidase SpoIIGA [Thermoanaerobacterium thermosaccharolyticum]PHO06491.1 sigma-E processing peptidase SpoIIGA [Thermoanaerobacterium thermosaccharolyticum]
MYVDVIFLENLIINYIILYLTKRFSKSKARNINLFFSSLLGASYVILIFFSLPNIIYSLPFKIIISILMIIITFGYKKLYEFIKIMSIFYLISFIVGGAAFALIYLANFDLKQIIIGALFISILLIYIGWGYISKKNLESDIIHVIQIDMNNIKKDIKAILDTGNTLHDPLSNYPVVIVEYNALKDLLPEGVKSLFDRGTINDIFEIPKVVDDDGWLKRFRLVPYNSIGTDSGMMVGFIPDNLIIDGNKKSFKNVIIGIYLKRLNATGDYEALIGSELLI